MIKFKLKRILGDMNILNNSNKPAKLEKINDLQIHISSVIFTQPSNYNELLTFIDYINNEQINIIINLCECDIYQSNVVNIDINQLNKLFMSQKAIDNNFYNDKNVKNLFLQQLYKKLNIDYIHTKLDDIMTENNDIPPLINKLSIIQQTVDDCAKPKNILIHCFAGINRSVLTACYLMINTINSNGSYDDRKMMSPKQMRIEDYDDQFIKQYIINMVKEKNKNQRNVNVLTNPSFLNIIYQL